MGQKNSIFRSGWNFGPSINNHVNVSFYKDNRKKFRQKLTFDYEKNFHEEILLTAINQKKYLNGKISLH